VHFSHGERSNNAQRLLSTLTGITTLTLSFSSHPRVSLLLSPGLLLPLPGVAAPVAEWWTYIQLVYQECILGRVYRVVYTTYGIQGVHRVSHLGYIQGVHGGIPPRVHTGRYTPPRGTYREVYTT